MGRKKKSITGNSRVDDLIGFKPGGNITPETWYKNITFKDGKPNVTAITILADIMFWYRPFEERDETTKESLGHKKKFKEDKLQASNSSYVKKFGFSNKQVREAMKKLKELGLIETELRKVKTKTISLNNVQFIDLNTPVLKRYSLEIIEKNIDVLPLRMEDTPSGTDALPLGMEDIPSGMEDIPSGMEDIPSGTDALPLGMEDIPSGTDALHTENTTKISTEISTKNSSKTSTEKEKESLSHLQEEETVLLEKDFSKLAKEFFDQYPDYPIKDYLNRFPELKTFFENQVCEIFQSYEKHSRKRMADISREEYKPLVLERLIRNGYSLQNLLDVIESAFQNWNPKFRSIQTIFKIDDEKNNLTTLMDLHIPDVKSEEATEQVFNPEYEKDADKVFETGLWLKTENELLGFIERNRSKNDPRIIEAIFQTFEEKYFPLKFEEFEKRREELNLEVEKVLELNLRRETPGSDFMDRIVELEDERSLCEANYVFEHSQKRLEVSKSEKSA